MEQLIKYGLIHCHTENSMKDSVLTPKSLARRAKEMGSPAVAISDHGTLTGALEFIKAINEINNDPKEPRYGEYDLKGIIGVELYLQEDTDIRNRHMVVYAKNLAGYRAISNAVTDSNKRILNGRPCVNMDIIRKWFASGTMGHGNVITTSACAGGILARILLRNNTLLNEVNKLKRRRDKYESPESTRYVGNREKVEEYHQQVTDLIAKRDALKKLAEMRFAKWGKTVAKMTGPEKEEEEIKLKEQKEKSAAAAIELETVKSELAKAKRRETVAKQACKEAEKDHEKWSYYNGEIKTIEAAMCSDEVLYDEALEAAREFAEIFGEGNFYIELQNHGIPDEAIVMPKLVKIAKALNLPLVACNDVHYANNTPEDVRARRIISALRYNKWNEEREDDTEYYIKSDAELSSALLKILPRAAVCEAFEGIAQIVAECNLQLPKETHFPKFVGGIQGETAEMRLRRLVEEGIKTRYPGQEFMYRDRVEYELKIINKMQYTDYLCIVQDYCKYGRKLGVSCPEGVGYAIGPGRGSAAGSLVCYLIGITSVDPIPLNLLFERFLNPDRVTSPDIDVDLSDEVRGKVLEYVKSKYGEKAVCCIMTKGTLAAKAAIKAVARVRSSEKGLPDGSFLDLGDAIAKMIPNVPGAKLTQYAAELRETFKDNNDAQEIISDALLVEGAAVNYGMHAAGVIIADNGKVSEYIPLMWNDKKEQWCTQCTMGEAEEMAGLLKFDFLGLGNLDIITQALRLIKRNTGTSIDIEKVPQEPKIYKEIFAKGKTNFVFQFESDGMKNLLRKFKPEKLEHLILLNALFRPGPLQYADPICEAKSGKSKPLYICEKARSILEPTYSYPVYQEQIMQLCNLIAGFTLGEADQVRRYMSKKKADKLAAFKPKFIAGLLNVGISDDYLSQFCKSKGIMCTTTDEKVVAQKQAAEDYWEQLMDFAKYGFNKSHAAVYATVAYYTAWLKYHYPTEYMTAILNNTEIDKLPKMVQECCDLGVKVLAPHVNKSKEGFTGKNGIILFGLSNIKNVGGGATGILEERERNGTYRSFKDLLQRARPSKKVCEMLIDAGGFDHWCSNRVAMKTILEDLLDDVKKVQEKCDLIDKLTKEIERPDLKESEIEILRTKIDSAKTKRDAYQSRFDYAVIPIGMPEDIVEKLNAENNLLGMYVSGHPIDVYPDAKIGRASTIASLEDKVNTKICGIISALNIRKRKRDGKPMAFFNLEDETGTAEVCCFTDAYEKFGSKLQENAAVIVSGKVNIEEEYDDDGIVTNTRTKLTLENIEVVKQRPQKVYIAVKGMHRWAEEVYPQVLPYVVENGAEVVLYDTALGEFRKTTLQVSLDILQADIENTDIIQADIEMKIAKINNRG